MKIGQVKILATKHRPWRRCGRSWILCWIAREVIEGASGIERISATAGGAGWLPTRSRAGSARELGAEAPDCALSGAIGASSVKWPAVLQSAGYAKGQT